MRKCQIKRKSGSITVLIISALQLQAILRKGYVTGRAIRSKWLFW